MFSIFRMLYIIKDIPEWRFSSYCVVAVVLRCIDTGLSFAIYSVFYYFISYVCISICVCFFSVPAPRCNVAPSAAADAAQTGRGDAERSLPLSQHQTGLQSGLRILTAGSRLQQVCPVYSF